MLAHGLPLFGAPMTSRRTNTFAWTTISLVQEAHAGWVEFFLMQHKTGDTWRRTRKNLVRDIRGLAGA